MTLSFNQQQIQQLFPFHLLLNADLEIISSGNSMVKVMPALRLGTAISQYFALEHSGFADTFSQAITQSTSFIIKSTSSNHYFMMQPVCFENGDVLLAGKPVINNNFSLTDYNLTINDFASKDNVVEQLFLIQATKKSLSDATTLNQEITAKNRALSQINERYEMVVNGVHDIIFQTDNDGNWIFLNKAWVTIMGFSLEETLCRPFFKYLHPDDVEKNMKLFTPLIERKKEYCSHQIRYIAKNGSIRWIKVYAVLTFDDNGNITGTSGTLQDITEQKESFEKYELLANNILDIVSIADLNAACVYVSPSIKSITGYDPEEFIGLPGYQITHEAEKEKLQHFFTSVFELKGKTSLLEHRLKTKQGKWIWVETSAKAYFNEEGKAIGIVTSSRTIQERKLAEAAVIKALKETREMSEMKSKFISVVSHEMKTPMTAIYSGTEIMELHTRQKAINDEVLNKQFRTIKTEVSKLNDLIEKILFWGKVEGGQIKTDKQQTDVLDFVSTLIEKYNSLQTDGRKMSVGYKGKPYKLFIDPAHLEYILGNLISNAFKFSAGKKTPELNIAFNEKKVVISIIDYGIGIPQNESSNLFQSFFRASNVEHIKGNGLGIAIAKHFAELNNGKINFTSEENEGSVFVLELSLS